MLVKEVQRANILDISVTFEVSKPVISRLVNPEQSENIELIFVTDEVSKSVRSISVNVLHFTEEYRPKQL